MPTLRGLPVVRIGAGEDHEVFSAGDQWLVRFPKSPERAEWLLRELSVLAVVGETITAGVPRPELQAPASAEFPAPFVSYRRIPGVAADRSQVVDESGLARDMAHTLDALHRVDPGRIPLTPAGWEGITLQDERAKLLSRQGRAAELLTPDLVARAAPYLAGTAPIPSRALVRRFIHNDICPDHLIVDPRTGRLTGIIDFTDAMVGDPVVDFVGLVGLGGRAFIDQVLAGYRLPLGDGFDETLRWLTRTLTLRWLGEAAADNPTHVSKHIRWVQQAFTL